MERRVIAVQGTVQGVGFRPYVYALASRLELGGFVSNQTGGVHIEVEGDEAPLDDFLSELVKRPPPLARIHDISWQRDKPVGDRPFRIAPSRNDQAGEVTIAPDAATCDDCLAELFDPRDRRFRYPFLNCTHCGPRLTIVTAAPYDRDRTTMVGFEMCADCRKEYEDPTNRRFHAQPIACPRCGPQLALLDARGKSIETSDPIAAVIEAILAGKIVAMKGLGGYHLSCDARNADSVARLRKRKHREEKPFAVMVRDVAAARQFCDFSLAEEALLASRQRPIVLLKKRENCDLSDQIAPENPFLGVMLPYTPLHHLLLHDLNGVPLVMTSGNRSDEPIAYEETDAVERLHDIADLFFVHDRPIHVRCDDSVTRIIGGLESPVRRSRGYAPQPISIPVACPSPILAVGGQIKGTFALGKNGNAVLSHHLGDLDDYEAYRAFERDVALFEKLFTINPSLIAHDLHPDYASTRYALRRSRNSGLPCISVQHHHAHMASCMAEHGLVGDVIGVTFDGSGYGIDGAVWGGEFLVGNYVDFQRAAHLRYVLMPGSEQAVHEPWRMAASHLSDANTNCNDFERRIPANSMRMARSMIDRKFNAPRTSSVGRLFDAVASLVGLRDTVAYEGQAAMQLEWLATTVATDGAYPFEISANEVDTRPMIRAVARDVDAGVAPARIARRFHSTLVELIAAICAKIRETTQIDRVVLSGGVFMNALLSIEADERLTNDGFQVYRHRLVPPNDGGLSLGQIAIAASQSALPG